MWPSMHLSLRWGGGGCHGDMSYFIFFLVASATATKFGLSRGLLGLQYDQINASESESVNKAKVKVKGQRSGHLIRRSSGAQSPEVEAGVMGLP